MEYYIVLNGVKEGPFALADLKSKGVTETTLVWKNGLTDWVKANTLPEVMEAITPKPAPQPIPAAPQPQPQTASPYQRPSQPTAAQPTAAPQPQPAPQTYSQPAQPRPAAFNTQSQQAVEPMPEDYTQKNIIAAIVGFLCCGVIGAIFAVIGFINGNDVKKYYNLGQYDLAAKKAAEAKKWFKISIIVDAILGVLFIIYLVVMFAFGFFASY